MPSEPVSDSPVLHSSVAGTSIGLESSRYDAYPMPVVPHVGASSGVPAGAKP